MNWLKQNPPVAWKWYHWPVCFLLCFASCCALLLARSLSLALHFLSGHPPHIAEAGYGAVGGVLGIASRNDWMRRKLRPHRQRRQK